MTRARHMPGSTDGKRGMEIGLRAIGAELVVGITQRIEVAKNRPFKGSYK